MTVKELARMVYEMRKAQKEYFKGRGSDSLEESKRLEREIDKTVEEVLRGQGSLFDTED